MLQDMIKLLVAVSCIGCISLAGAADVVAGKAVAQAKCVECHEAADWEGEDAASLSGLIADIAAGKIKHKKKFQLSASEIADIAAYWGQGGK